MGQKTHPKGFRLIVRRDWNSRWSAKGKQEHAEFLAEDYEIRKYLKKKLRYAAVSAIYIERSRNRLRITIRTARPGIVIGRKGQELDRYKEEITKMTGRDVMIDVVEVKKPDLEAQLVAENIALQLERRVAFRRALKKAVQTTMSLGADGIKAQVAGRLGGADIARTEVQRDGRVPLQTIRADVDYGFAEASTVYGIIGVKVWICRPSEEPGRIANAPRENKPRRAPRPTGAPRRTQK